MSTRSNPTKSHVYYSPLTTAHYTTPPPQRCHCQYNHGQHTASQFQDHHPVALLMSNNTVAGISKIPSIHGKDSQIRQVFPLLPFSSKNCSPCTSLTLYLPPTFQFVSAHASDADFAAAARPWPKAAMGTASIAATQRQGEFPLLRFCPKILPLHFTHPLSSSCLPIAKGAGTYCGFTATALTRQTAKRCVR